MIQLSKYVQVEQAKIIADLLMKDGALRLYSGEQPPLEQRTDGRLVSCKIISAVVDGGKITISWEAGVAEKAGTANYYRCVSGNIPVLSGSIPDEMQIDDTKILAATETNSATVIDAGFLTHNVFGSKQDEHIPHPPR